MKIQFKQSPITEEQETLIEFGYPMIAEIIKENLEVYLFRLEQGV